MAKNRAALPTHSDSGTPSSATVVSNTSSTRRMKSKEKNYKIALIGLGHRGYNTHFANIVGSRSETIIAVCDANQATLASFTAKHPDVAAYSSLSPLLRNHKLDFAIVCVPHKFHLECVSLLAEAGVPVLKEKPAATSPDELAELSRLPIKIGVTFQKRFEPRFMQLEKLLPLIGEVVSFRATLAKSIPDLESTWRAMDGVGVTEDLGCHMLDLVVSLFGAPSSLVAHSVQSVRRFQTYGGDDICNINLRFNASNIVGHVHLSRVAHEEEESIIVTGTTGTLCLSGSKVTLVDSLGRQSFEMVDTSTKQSVVRNMVRKFGDFATDRAADFPSSISNLVDTVAIIEATKRSFETSRTETLHQAPDPISANIDGEHHVWPLITTAAVEAVVDQMHSSLSIYNRSNIYEVFEERWLKMHGVKHALVCSSGTVAIFHMFEALDLRPGDEVLCPVYTFFATASPMLQYGAVPIFCDALPDGNLDPAEILKKSTPKTKAIIVTHMWGLPCAMTRIMNNASKVNGGIKVLEDCSHAHGAVVDGKIVGSWGHMAAWSLQAKKNVTGGQAGVLATNSTDYYARAITHGHFNKRAKQEVPEDHPFRKFWLTGLGLNMRAHPLAIALANQQLDSMQSYDLYRQKYAAYISRRLSTIPFLRIPSVESQQTDKHAWYAFVMRFDESKAPKGLTREKFVSTLLDHGLKEVDIPRSTGLLNELPLFTHSHEAIPRYGSKQWHALQPNSLFPVASSFFDTAIKLPMWATPGDQTIVQRYADVFVEVSEQFIGHSLKDQKNEDDHSGCYSGRPENNTSTQLMFSSKL